MSREISHGDVSTGEIDLGQIAGALSRRRRIVIGVTLAAFLGALAFVNIVKPRYTAEARVLLENQESYLTRADKERADPAAAPDAEAVQSQIQMLTSRDLARRVLKSLDLQGNSEFDPIANGLGLGTKIGVMLGLTRDPSKLAPEERMLDAYFDKLLVLSPTKTRVLQIEFSARDPDLAARAANAIASFYIDIQREAKRENARDAAQSLSPLVADLRERLARAEAKVEAFRSRSGLFAGTNNMTIATQQLGDLANQLSISRTAQADAEAKARLVRDMLRQNRVGEIPDVANNEMIRRIGEQRVSLRAQLALESRTLLPGHPRIKELQAQLADLEADWRRAAERTARTLENEAHIASARVENLARAMDEQKRVAGAAGADEVQLRELERAARVLKDQLEADSAKYQEALARDGPKASPADARVIQRAVAPPIPSFPKKVPITAFATIAAFVLSAGSIIAIELLSGRARVRGTAPLPAPRLEEREEEELETPPKARIAAANRREPIFVEPEDEEEEAPPPPMASLAAESRTRLSPARTPKLESRSTTRAYRSSVVGKIDAARMATLSVKVLMVGCADAEHSFDSAVTLSRALARRGLAIIVAADAQERGELYDRLIPDVDRARPLGLADLSSGAATFAEAIHRDADSRLHVMPGGRAAAEYDQDAEPVLEALAQTYDFIVFATRDYDRAMFLAPSFDIVLVSGSERAAEAVIDELAQAGVRDAFLLEDETAPADASAA
ncbi:MULTISPECIES: exopolysaccharide transport family protein [unclassified Methylosinus]|uniref:GumC family protein n=1 Tax=unclassified Methylosinus TaxID=2624500 RepID=UPI0004638B67|nr:MULTISPECIES: exopolysaccharide transport family protein [unclassified Methylosinus]